MPSDGDAVERYLRVVRVQLDADTVPSLDAALEQVPVAIRDRVRARFEEEVTQQILPVRAVSEHGGPRAWAADWDASEGYYWRRQRNELLARPFWTARSVESLDDSSDMVLSFLDDPRPSGPDAFDVRGLVMGYVQSGKTANYCALIAKAADLGYKFVIVLSGIHNSLRQQTQKRVNAALGIAGGPPPEAGRRWIALTQDGLHGDFRAGTADNSVLQGNERVVAVTKKNKSVLVRLLDWIAEVPSVSLPVLIVDDEADQASINTGGNRGAGQAGGGEEEVDAADLTDLEAGDTNVADDPDELNPSVINGLIRELISRFQRVSYVAYTATPFANVLIDHEAWDRVSGEDLYPRDFVVSLPRPAGYVGAERLFGRDALPDDDGEVAGLDLFCEVERHEAEEQTPPSRDIALYRGRITLALEGAFLDFILASAAYDAREGVPQTCSMLVHTHHRTSVQNVLAGSVREHLAGLRQFWKYDRSAIEQALRDRWEAEFRTRTRAINAAADLEFEQLKPHLDALFRDPLELVVLNSDSDDVLDYDTSPGAKVVVIGGNRLSRGLTLEGLLISYYVREANAYDTLMQMGRWFGFRERYLDLTRIYTTARLFGWFRDLALAEAELRDEMARYERDGLTPLQLGLTIRSHPQLPPTAQNKLGSGATINRSYAERLVQTTYFKVDDAAWLEHNVRAVADLLAELGPPSAEGGAKPSWKNVDVDVVLNFLSQYRTDPRAAQADTDPIRKYISKLRADGELTDWWVSVRSRHTVNPDLGVEERWAAAGEPMARINRSGKKMIHGCIGSLVTPAMPDSPGKGDEEVGLTRDQIESARDSGMSFSLALRRERSTREGLLLIYPISPFSAPNKDSSDRAPLMEAPHQAGTVAGIAIAFPSSQSHAATEYYAGSVERRRRGAEA